MDTKRPNNLRFNMRLHQTHRTVTRDDSTVEYPQVGRGCDYLGLKITSAGNGVLSDGNRKSNDITLALQTKYTSVCNSAMDELESGGTMERTMEIENQMIQHCLYRQITLPSATERGMN
ncbi:hypothetical protein TNCV_91701 [Trichonephila clavipes]|nr:hypothetical protein TNCV_91701 [Trichonephila clavipes]